MSSRAETRDVADTKRGGQLAIALPPPTGGRSADPRPSSVSVDGDVETMLREAFGEYCQPSAGGAMTEASIGGLHLRRLCRDARLYTAELGQNEVDVLFAR